MRETRVSICRYGLLLAPMLTFLVAAAPGPEEATDLERNRRLLEKWKAEPEHYARLQRDLHDFWALPEAKRRQLRRLDRDFHQLDARAQKRLWKVAERYMAWLERLPDDERRRIEETKDAQQRLRLIRAVRERQWIERLPRKVQENLDQLPDDARSAEVARLREQQRQQRLLWKRPLNPAPRNRQPSRPADLPAEARSFIEKQLLPHLTPDEKRQYNAALGRWPEFPGTVKELAKKHPVLPPLHKPIVRFEDLPDRAKVEAGSKPSWERREDAWKQLRQVEGKWPEWALRFHSFLSKPQRQRMPPLGASRPEDFPANVRDFLKKPLKQKVSKQEWKELHSLQGKWPEYPLNLLRLAEKHKLEVPGLSLPGGGDW
ncbi:MAG TPA: hypothetical protein VMG10_33235 [Gemmataceae bacterium]|nr:hypothetical protein [Gemmataceae bacterium]